MNCVTDCNIDVMASGLDARGTPAGEGSISKNIFSKAEMQHVYQIKRRKLCQALPVAARPLPRISCCTAAIFDVALYLASCALIRRQF
jgi:hypothetical protein